MNFHAMGKELKIHARAYQFAVLKKENDIIPPTEDSQYTGKRMHWTSICAIKFVSI